MDITELNNIQFQIDAYRAGKLSEEETESLWVELMEHPEQMEYLINSVNLAAIATEEFKASDRDTALKIVKAPQETVLFHITRKWSRIAAVFALAIGIISTAYFWGNDFVQVTDPIANIELDSFRSSTIPTVVFDYQLQRAINLASMEKYDEALAKLQEIETQNLSQEQQISLEVNKGSVYYNKGDFTSAKTVFHVILDQYDEMHLLTEEQVHWFLGNTYLQLGNTDLAMRHIQKTYDLNGAYRRLAERYLN